MVEREPGLNEALFMGLVINLQSTAMIALGKLINPSTQKIERNLDQARFTIDMLGMLEDKTNNNRTEEETRTLRRVLTELRMNYLDELEKDNREQEKKAEEKTGGEAAEKTEGKAVHEKDQKPAAQGKQESAQEKAQKTADDVSDRKA